VAIKVHHVSSIVYLAYMTGTVVDDLTLGDIKMSISDLVRTDLSVTNCDDVIHPNRTATGHFRIRSDGFLF
jgi:hypothetical protein